MTHRKRPAATTAIPPISLMVVLGMIVSRDGDGANCHVSLSCEGEEDLVEKVHAATERLRPLVDAFHVELQAIIGADPTTTVIDVLTPSPSRYVGRA